MSFATSHDGRANALSCGLGASCRDASGKREPPFPHSLSPPPVRTQTPVEVPVSDRVRVRPRLLGMFSIVPLCVHWLCIRHRNGATSPTLPYPTLPYPTLPYLTLPYPTLPYHSLSYLTLPYTTLNYSTLPYLPHHTLSYPIISLISLPEDSSPRSTACSYRARPRQIVSCALPATTSPRTSRLSAPPSRRVTQW